MVSLEVTMQEVTARQALSDALRYWEPRRILYNGALALVVTAVYFMHLPASRGDLTLVVVYTKDDGETAQHIFFDSTDSFYIQGGKCAEFFCRVESARR